MIAPHICRSYPQSPLTMPRQKFMRQYAANNIKAPVICAMQCAPRRAVARRGAPKGIKRHISGGQCVFSGSSDSVFMKYSTSPFVLNGESEALTSPEDERAPCMSGAQCRPARTHMPFSER